MLLINFAVQSQLYERDESGLAASWQVTAVLLLLTLFTPPS